MLTLECKFSNLHHRAISSIVWRTYICEYPILLNRRLYKSNQQVQGFWQCTAVLLLNISVVHVSILYLLYNRILVLSPPPPVSLPLFP
jgi:hypothetical protein